MCSQTSRDINLLFVLIRNKQMRTIYFAFKGTQTCLERCCSGWMCMLPCQALCRHRAEPSGPSLHIPECESRASAGAVPESRQVELGQCTSRARLHPGDTRPPADETQPQREAAGRSRSGRRHLKDVTCKAASSPCGAGEGSRARG